MLRPSLIALCISALPAYAQTSATSVTSAPATTKKAATPDKIQQVEIKGNANTYDPRRDDTASKIVVTSEEIKRYGDTSVLDVFKRLPGITVSGASGRGGEIRMRGLGSGYTQILINGERAPAGFSIDQLSPDVIERIEILRAASAEFSTQSIAGTINIVLKKSVQKAQRELRAGVGRSRDASNPSASLQMSDRVEGMSYSVSANAMMVDYDRQSPVEESALTPDGRLAMLRRTRAHDQGTPYSISLAPRINWTGKKGGTLTWQSLVAANRNDYHGYAVTDTLLGQAPLYDVRDTDSKGTNAILRSDLNWVRELGEGAKIDLKLGVNGMRNRGTWREHDDSMGLRGRDALVLSRTSERGLTSTGKYATSWKKDHALSMGWDGGYTLRDDARIEDEAFPQGGRSAYSDERYEAKLGRLALFVQDEWNLTPRWSMYLGLRWEGLETTSEGNTFATTTNRSSVWSPLAQTLYKLPDSRDQLRLALTRTYKAPAASSLIPRRFTTPNNSQTDPDYRGNPDLKPELATGIDASYEHYWAEKALLSASVSVRRIQDFTRQGLILENGRWIQTPVNDGDAVTRSLELEAKFPLSAVRKGGPDLDLRASISRNWSRVEEVPGPHNRLDQQTPLSATLGVDWRAPGGKLSAGSSFAFKSGGPVRINLNQSGYQSVRRDLDMYALYKFNPKYQLRFAVSNILRQDFLDDSVYTDASGTQCRTRVFPGYAMARLTLEARY
ncbi:TonB-dependent receptor [Massilia sp. IC2-477]|uniref:TonB-dependent receptor plug domain-containing protein n=1 Tax=Massilia sp. IC2-477 TaxID=2887198 RepID=UPI001D11ED88|nr:TonB-dependent receptor [Massilia sp. IC2-477]MCC2954451.1 TonB-dependent receptor [Massilia sp. IC2-477]